MYENVLVQTEILKTVYVFRHELFSLIILIFAIFQKKAAKFHLQRAFSKYKSFNETIY